LGGGIFNATGAKLTLDPRLGARKGSRQSKAVDNVTANQANRGLGGPGGQGGDGFGGSGGRLNGAAGAGLAGPAGPAGLAGAGVGGGVVRDTSLIVTINNTNITGNTASTTGNDVGGVGAIMRI
jgi:hypothetical protein